LIALLVLLLAADAGPAPAKEGPNDKFLRPDLDVPTWVLRFEKPGREVFDKRKEIVAALHLEKGAAVADVGAGTGLFTMAFAKAVGPAGRVYAVEIAPRFLDYLKVRAKKAGAKNVQVVRGTADSVELPPESVDVVFLCDTYHHFEHPQKNLASIRRALRRDGELVVVDFKREPGKTPAWITEHVRAGQAEVTAEIEAGGFAKVDELPILKENYLLRFRLRK
jgi:ubiquinone/menaquinone biosynthesis C-methylase UbiE